VPGVFSKSDGYLYNEQGIKLGKADDIGTGADDLLRAGALEEFAGMHSLKRPWSLAPASALSQSKGLSFSALLDCQVHVIPCHRVMVFMAI